MNERESDRVGAYGLEAIVEDKGNTRNTSEAMLTYRTEIAEVKERVNQMLLSACQKTNLITVKFLREV